MNSNQELKQRELVISLYDIYSSLLTDKQKMYFEEYYYCDMTLQEISQEHNVSRNAVFDQIKKTINLCEKYESSIHKLQILKLLNETLKKDNISDIKEDILSIIDKE